MDTTGPRESATLAFQSNNGCLARIRRALPELSGARLRIAEYILSQPWVLHGASISEFASRCGVSENAVSRFARTVGYAGYRGLSQALTLNLGRDLAVSHSHPLEVIKEIGEKREGATRLVARIFELEVSYVRDTLESLDESLLERIIAALSEARRILLIGTGSAAPLCQMAQYRFSNIGLHSLWASDPMVMVSEVSLLGPEDVVLGVSYSGRTRVATQVLDYARTQRKAMTVCLTAGRGSPITEVSDIPIVIFSPNVSAAGGRFCARISGMVLLEAIATAVTVRKYGTMTPPNLDELSEMQMRINSLNPDLEPQPARKRSLR